MSKVLFRKELALVLVLSVSLSVCLPAAAQEDVMPEVSAEEIMTELSETSEEAVITEEDYEVADDGEEIIENVEDQD